MTTEIQEYKCPTCGNLLGEEEFLYACEKNQMQVRKQVEEISFQKDSEHKEEIQRVCERYESEREKVISTKVSEALNEERTVSELKHKQELALKDEKYRQLEVQSSRLIERAKSEVLNENEARHLQREKELELQLSRANTEYRNLMYRAERMQKTLDNIPPELRGTAGEFILIDELKKEFKTDELIPKKNGVSMADVVQKIVTSKGEKLSIPIVYDKKMASDVTAADIAKAKKYRIIHNTDHSIIVTKDIKGKGFTEERDGVLLVHPLAVLDTSRRIRSFLIWTSHQSKISSGKDFKNNKLVELLTSPEYNRDMQRKIDARLKLEGLQTNEENYHSTMWKKRNDLLREWFELDSKYEARIRDIIEEEESKDDSKR
jgi:hypothetical protein